MKKIVTIILPMLLFVISMSFLMDSEKMEEAVIANSAASKLEIPDNIQSILDKSCLGCHSEGSKNQKAKMKLTFEKFDNGKYSTGKQIAKLNGIAKTIEKGKMPTKKFVEKYPDRALSDADAKALIEWAKAQASAMAGE